jgi:hypothetical protein
MRLLAQARNPYSLSWLWIPGSRYARPGMTTVMVMGPASPDDGDENTVTSQIYTVNVHRRLHAQFGEIRGEPVARAFSAVVAKEN